MTRLNSYRIANLALLGLILAVAAPSAWAQVPPPPETHFRCYIVSEQTPQAPTDVTLDDQFPPDAATEIAIDEPLQFCAPVSKNGEVVDKPEEHLTMYGAAANLVPHQLIETED